jgi:hypothetical protein
MPMVDLSFLHPTDLQQARDFLQQRGLKDNADDTRAKILSCWESVDIPACPGSGKTTILVTKLAWAIERWKLDGAGICVLSHTNVAKDEIKKRLTANQAGKLFSYPHFVGTIQEFVDKFIALPVMRSCNKTVRIIDDDIHDGKAKNILEFTIGVEIGSARSWQQKHAHQNIIGGLRFIHDGLQYKDRKTGKYYDLPIGEATNSYKGFRKIKEMLQGSGFYCYDELLFIAQDVIDQKIISLDGFQARFPLVFMDEAQDNNETQAKLLSFVFSPQKVVVQRFGDADQQIFDFGEKAITDSFPCISRCNAALSLRETQRCNSAISLVASKFSLGKAHIQSVRTDICSNPPHLILFDDEESAQKVIIRFVDILPVEIKQNKDAIVKVVGQVGKEDSGSKNFPRSICDYENAYLKPANGRYGSPRNLYDAVENSRRAFAQGNENVQAINIFFAGIIYLLSGSFDNLEARNAYRKVKERLKGDKLNSKGFRGKELLGDFCDIYEDIVLNSPEYSKIEMNMKDVLSRWGFIKHTDTFFSIPETHRKKAHNYISLDGVMVEINTIAGIKGETHTATLVLETFYYDHNIENAMKAMVGKGRIAKPSDLVEKRVKNLYVAMTRPTDFLCLALPRKSHDELCQDQNIHDWFETFFVVKC